MYQGFATLEASVTSGMSFKPGDEKVSPFIAWFEAENKEIFPRS
jgi:hypothetical protein